MIYETNEPTIYGEAIDLELFEAIEDPLYGVIKPNRIRINGVECLTPDTPVVVEGLLDRTQPLKATMTVYVRSLKVHAE